MTVGRCTECNVQFSGSEEDHDHAYGERACCCNCEDARWGMPPEDLINEMTAKPSPTDPYSAKRRDERIELFRKRWLP